MVAKTSAKKSAKKSPAKKAVKASARSSKSGKFVSGDFAKKHPATTQNEKRKAKKVAVKVENGKSAVVVTQTDAAKSVYERPIVDVLGEMAAETGKVLFHASHAEAVQAAENDNKEFVAEIVPQPSVLEVARQAWGEVKGSGDPEFDACVSTHRDKFLSHAEAILKGGSPMEGETQLARFERAVSALNKEN